uniref:Uncharacterized protein n=1 Tax=Anguilla anguilla TaxID=7936 RepID=A0A0E9PW64_ANGAN
MLDSYKALPIQQLEQGCPTLLLEIYPPVGFHSNPNKALLTQQSQSHVCQIRA